MFVKGSLSFDLNRVKCTRKVAKGREKPEEGSKLSSKSANGLRQKVQKTGIFELFWPLMSIWRMRNELNKYKQLLRYQGSPSRVLQ